MYPTKFLLYTVVFNLLSVMSDSANKHCNVWSNQIDLIMCRYLSFALVLAILGDIIGSLSWRSRCTMYIYAFVLVQC